MTLVSLADLLRDGSLAALGTIAWASVEGAIVGGLVWAICRAVPAMPAALRTWLWWFVSAKLLLGVLPIPAVGVPWLPATATPTAVVASGSGAAEATVPVVLASTPAVAAATRDLPAPRADAQPVTLAYLSFWPCVVLLAWFALVVLQAAGLVRALQTARGLRRQATAAPAGIVHRAAQLVALFAVPVMPRVLASRLSAVPLITGVFRPAILLPAGRADTLSRAELDLVLGHELAHVRRGDLAWGWVPAIAARLFFFHPLARLAVREYLAAREEACDAEVLQTLDAAPADYGRLIVKLGVATTDDVLAAAGSSPSFTLLKRRLIMLDRSSTRASRWWWTLAIATGVVLPLTLVAQPAAPVAPAAPAPDVALGPDTWPQADVPAPPAPPAPPDAPAPPPAPVDQGDEAIPAPPVPPVPPAPSVSAVAATAPVAPVPPAAPVAAAPPAPPSPPPPPPAFQDARTGQVHVRSAAIPFVLVEPGDRHVMSGSSTDRAEAERHRNGADDTFLWFRYDGQAYVTRDPATIQAVRDTFERVSEIGNEMGRLGTRMGTQGERQAEVGRLQADIGAKQAELAGRMATIAAERAARSAEEAQRRLADDAAARAAQRELTREARASAAEQREEARALRETFRKEQRTIERQLEIEMKAMTDRQHELGREMEAFGRIMAERSAEMKVAGERMNAAVADAHAQAAALFGSAVGAGKASPVR